MNILHKLWSRITAKHYFGFQQQGLKDYPIFSSTKSYLDAYSANLFVHTCVKKRAEKVGQVEFQLYRGEQEILEHELLNVLYKPNSFMNKNEFFSLYQTYKDLTGSAYILILPLTDTQRKTKFELHLLRPDWISFLVGGDGNISEYVYRTSSGKEFKFEKKMVIASHYPNPTDALRGLSPLKPGSLAIDTDNQLTKYHANVIRNGGKIEGLLTFKTDNLTSDQIAEIRKSFKEQYAGADKSGTPFIGYGDIAYQNLGLNPQELSFIESKKMTRDDILLLFQVPKSVLGLTDDVQKGNYEESVRAFLSETIKPLIVNLVEKLNENLFPPELELTFVDPTPADMEMKIKKVESGIRSYFMTPNEARAEFGLEPIENGDELLVPFSVVPLGSEQQEESDEAKSEEKQCACSKKKTEHPLKSKENRKVYWKKWDRTATARENLLVKVLRKYLKEQAKRIIEKLTAGVIKPKGLADELFDIGLEVDLGKKKLLPILMKFLEASGNEALENMGVDRDFNVSVDARITIEERAQFFVRELNATTFKKLQSEFQDSIDAGEGYTDLAKRIENTYDVISRGRAMTIARTETLVASQTGTMEGYKQSGVDIKIWVAVQDDRTRESHSSIDGEERGLHLPFSNGLMYPGAPDGPAEEVINCRCSI